MKMQLDFKDFVCYLKNKVEKADWPVTFPAELVNKYDQKRSNVIVKCVPMDMKSYSLIEKDLKKLVSLKGENLVQLILAEFIVDKVYLAYEYLEQKSLAEYVANYKGILEEDQIRNFIKMILEGYKVLHDNNLLHMNISPNNILLVKGKDEDSQVLKLCDFGLWRKFYKVTEDDYYTAPEVFTKAEYNKASDIWSIGAVMYYIINKNVPLDSKGMWLNNSQKGVYYVRQNISRFCLDFLAWCLTSSVIKRPTFKDLLEHPFIEGNKKGWISKSSIDHWLDESGYEHFSVNAQGTIRCISKEGNAKVAAAGEEEKHEVKKPEDKVVKRAKGDNDVNKKPKKPLKEFGKFWLMTGRS